MIFRKSTNSPYLNEPLSNGTPQFRDKCVLFTVWKFNDFPITQIIREINLRDFRGAKSAIFAHLEALYFSFCKIVHFLKAETYQINRFRASKLSKNGSFCSNRFSKIEFTQNLSDRKILKFPHCAPRS